MRDQFFGRFSTLLESSARSLFVLGNVTVNEVHGTQHNYRYGVDSIAHGPDMPANFRAR
jgi:hypothetical protein